MKKLAVILATASLLTSSALGEITNFSQWKITVSYKDGTPFGAEAIEKIILNHNFKKSDDAPREITKYIHTKYSDQSIVVVSKPNQVTVNAILYKPALFQSFDPKSVFSEIIEFAKKHPEISASDIETEENVKPK
jgi:hypothetical protein